MNPACPACGTATQLDRWDDVKGFLCPACRGHAIRAGQLAEFFRQHRDESGFNDLTRAARQAPTSPRPLTCPDCDTRTYHVLRRGPIELDVCATCTGLFLDEGEATMYLRQVRYDSKPGRRAMDVVVSTVDGLGALGQFFSFFFHH